ncbi:hypothetical protein A2U01_0044973, partial [Trifolium medium]|nr:hypothetical protein [Trifolium medium]
MPFEFNFFNLFLFILYYLFNVRKANAPTRNTRTPTAMPENEKGSPLKNNNARKPTTRRKNVITFEEGLKTLQEG